MSFDQPARRYFRDILDAIELVGRFTAGLDFDSFCENPLVIAGVERKLHIIGEAAIRLGGEAERTCPDQPWKDIRGIGNHLRHTYDRVSLEMIWSSATRDLPSLKDCVTRALSQ